MRIMARERIALTLAACFLIAVSAGQTRSQMSPPKEPVLKPDMTREEKIYEEFKRRALQWPDQRREMDWKRAEMALARLEAEVMATLKRLLRADERQWRLVKPRYDKVQELRGDAVVGVQSWGNPNGEGVRWGRRRWGSGRPMRREEMSESERAIEELIDVMEDKNAEDEQIRQKIDGVQRAREKAKKQLPEARRELRRVLNDHRQEAVFLLMQVLD